MSALPPVAETLGIEPQSVDDIGDLKRATVRGTAWTAGSRLSQQLLQLAITIVLARLLLPREFGLVGMIAVFTGFAMSLVDSGFGAALVQRKSLTRAHLSTAFWLNLGVGLALSGVAAAVAPLVADFYNQPRLSVIMPVVGLNFVLVSLTIVQTALLERRMMFRRIAIVENAALVAAGVVGIVCAASGLGVWSLVVFTLVSNGAEGCVLWALSDWKPTWSFDRGALDDLWAYGRNLVGANALNYWMRNADNLLVGRFVGAASLGVYTRAYTLMLLPLNQVSYVVGRTLFPALSRLQEDVVRVRRAYLRSVRTIAFLTFPVATGLFVSARPLILTLLGHRWVGVVPLLQVLAIPALAQSIGATTGVIYQARARTDTLFRWTVGSGIVTLVAFAIGIQWGTMGIAVAYAIISLILTYFNFAIAGRLIDVRFRNVVATVGPTLLLAVGMGAVAWLCGQAVGSNPTSVQLLTEVAVGAVVYIGVAHLVRLKPYVELREITSRRRSDEAPLATAPRST